jgi:hypothetical protein
MHAHAAKLVEVLVVSDYSLLVAHPLGQVACTTASRAGLQRRTCLLLCGSYLRCKK